MVAAVGGLGWVGSRCSLAVETCVCRPCAVVKFSFFESLVMRCVVGARAGLRPPRRTGLGPGPWELETQGGVCVVDADCDMFIALPK